MPDHVNRRNARKISRKGAKAQTNAKENRVGDGAYGRVELYSMLDQSLLRGFMVLPNERTETMSVNWNTDADAALAEAKESNKPLLVDFSAAPD